MKVIKIREIKRFFDVVIEDEKIRDCFIVVEDEKGKLFVLYKKMLGYLYAVSLTHAFDRKNEKIIKEELKRRRKSNG